jgi:SAM-dependent methyltransferase
MDIRDSRHPLVLASSRWLARVNARHPWSHNEHFHGWILRHLPARRELAVDVGCGTGVLAEKLAPRFRSVIGIDSNEGMAAAAHARLAADARVSVRHCRLADFRPEPGADLITMVAVLHHLDLEATLARLPELLAPGGRLLVVGLARVDSLADYSVDLISAVANPLVGLIRHPRPARPADPAAAARRPAMPMRDPVTTLAEIMTVAQARLPGSVVRRRLFFRYTLRWDKPDVR